VKSLGRYYELHRTDLTRLDARLTKVVSIVSALPSGAVLDIGCGRGTLLAALRARTPQNVGGSYVGVDISEAAVGSTQARGFRAKVASLEHGLPFADEVFDTVIFGEVIEHLYDPDAALLEISRVLKRNGRLVLTTPNLAYWVNRLLLLSGTHPIFPEVSVHVQLGRRHKKLGQGNPAVGHIRVFTLPALKDMLAGNGFSH
jgi:methionine biosynthesis protein MetW